MFARPWQQSNPPYPGPDPIHLNADGWYFWDEIWCDEHGPFATREECVENLITYCALNCLT